MRHVCVWKAAPLLAALAAAALAPASASAGETIAPEKIETIAPEKTCDCAETAKPRTPADFTRSRGLDEADETAALAGIQLGLTRMDDGTPFVWKSSGGRLSGIVRPTASFRNQRGAVCRHVVVLLTTGFKTRSLEGIACRSDDRRWVLEG